MKREPSPIEIARDKYIASLTPEERKAKAVKAAKARWGNTRLQKVNVV